MVWIRHLCLSQVHLLHLLLVFLLFKWEFLNYVSDVISRIIKIDVHLFVDQGMSPY